jgi:1,2-diacylglycerol-3-alpha-glucose alpha-1,2-glucosyltransferase
MKICLYLEFRDYFKNKKIGTGILSSYRNQKAMLNYLQTPFVEVWDDSCDILQTNTPWPRSIYYMKKAKARGKKVIIWSHVTMEDAMQVFWFTPFFAPLLKRYLKYAYGLADVVFCPTVYTKSLLAAYGLPAEKLVVQSNAVDLKRFFFDEQARVATRQKFGLDSIVVGTIGQVQPRKGVDTFLRLADRFSNLQFIWFGNFFSKLIVKPLPANLPKNTQFTGFVENILKAFNTLDIFIFPSYEENQGMVILEAAAVGLPILVRDIPAYNGWLVHGENCLKAKTDEEFEQYLNQLTTDETLRKRLGSQAKKLAQDNSLEALGERLRTVYTSEIFGK